MGGRECVSESPNFNDIPDNGPVSERVGGESKFSYSVGISIVGGEKIYVNIILPIWGTR